MIPDSGPEDPRPAGWGSRTAAAAIHIGVVAAAVALGTLFAWLATTFGIVDRKIVGSLLAPLAIVSSAELIALGLGALHRRRVIGWLDRNLLPSDPALRVMSILALIAVGYEIVRTGLFAFVGYPLTDLPSYHYASLSLLDRIDPYVAKHLEAYAGHHVFPYVYPPFLALLWMPMARLPFEVVAAIFLVVSLAALAGSFVLAIRLAAPATPAARAATLIAALLLALGLPAYVNAHHGAVSSIFTCLLFLFFDRLQKGKDRQAGAVLAIACGIKVLPVILLLYLAAKRRWRPLVATLAVGASLLLVSVVVLGWRVHWRFITDIAPQLGYAVHSTLGYDAIYHPENQSINGFMSRVVCGGRPGCSVLIVLLCLAAAVPIGLAAWRRRDADPAETGAVLLALLLVSPLTWIHHLLLLALPILVMTARVVEGSWRPVWWPFIALAAAVIEVHDFGKPVAAITGFVPLQNIKFAMIVFLYAASLHLLRQTRRAPGPDR